MTNHINRELIERRMKFRGAGILQAVSVLFLMFTGCKKFVQIAPPSTVLVTPSVFNNDGAAHSALTAIYSQMSVRNSESYNMSVNSGLLADELSNLSNSFLVASYQDALFPNINTYNYWGSAYNYIYQSNAVVEGLATVKGTTPAIAAQLIGEAKFIRAFWHFYLVNAFGDVPLVTSTNYAVNAQLARAPKDQVYGQIIADLNSAMELLNTNYVDGTDTASTTQRARPNKAVAAALLARVYLYSNKYDSAELEATSVISDSRFSLVQNLNNVFLADASEAIWQLAVTTPDPGYQTGDGNQYILITAPVNANALISDQLFNCFDSGDLRKSNWINSYSDGTTTWYFPFKYQVYDNSTNPNNRHEATMVLRLAEQYLIRAEARAQLGNTNGALADLNAIRERAGLVDYTGATDKASLLAAILHERQVELFTEWGHRWFDLIRTGNINSVLGAPGNICQQKGGTWSPDGHQALYPIPQGEIDKDHNLTQNPGY